jgi:hypothetical protein
MKGFSIFLLPMEEYDSFGEKIGLNFANSFAERWQYAVHGTETIGTRFFQPETGGENGKQIQGLAKCHKGCQEQYPRQG